MAETGRVGRGTVVTGAVVALDVVGIVGAGRMGIGIARIAATSGFDVILTDLEDDVLARATAEIDAALGREGDRGRLDAGQRRQALAHITTSIHVAAHETADLVIESAVESLEIKAEIFRQLDRVCPPHTILASNTSSISITRLATVTNRPGLVAGMHFMNPVPAMQLVEVVRGMDTTDATVAAVEAAARRMGKQPIVCLDAPGFVSNRVLLPMINEAIFVVAEGTADAASVDDIMRLGMNHPMGPLRLADLIGLDAVLSTLRRLHAELGDPKYRPCPLLVKMVAAGRLGRRVGRGFYEYPEP
jgi:3-hydroxybutyryl-CoA dehydrogenase